MLWTVIALICDSSYFFSLPYIKPQKKANWRAKHNDLIQTIKAARGEAPPPPPAVNPDYVQCPYCARNFNEHAAERHMPFCKEQQIKAGIKTKSKADIAKEKLSKRTQVLIWTNF